MSNFQAIGGVSATLQALLRDRMELPAGMTRADLQVTISIPQPEDLQTPEPARVNLFLYRVTENGCLKNQMIPGQGHPSEYGHPPLSLNLHYLLTTYGATDDNGLPNETRAHFLLGSAMRVLHDHGIVTEQLLTIQAPAGVQILHPTLRGEFEKVKLTLEPLSVEDLSKVWTALNRPFRLSSPYSISVVQIESRRLMTLAAPVLTRQIHVSQMQRPEITAVYRTPLLAGELIGDTRAHVLQELTIEGHNFRAARTWVKIGSLEPLQVLPVSPELIRVSIPDDTYPVDDDHPVTRTIPITEQLSPGAQTVEVRIRKQTEFVAGGLDAGVVGTDDRVQLSNQSVFLLVPEVTTVVPAAAPVTTLLTVNGRRLFRPPAKSVVLVGDVSIPVVEPGPADPWAAPTDLSVQVPLTALTLTTPPTPLGSYPVRVMVNGAQNIETRTFTLT